MRLVRISPCNSRTRNPLSAPDCRQGSLPPRSTLSRFLRSGLHASGAEEERWNFCIRIALVWIFTRRRWWPAFVI
jgi:hypothetical protein